MLTQTKYLEHGITRYFLAGNLPQTTVTPEISEYSIENTKTTGFVITDFTVTWSDVDVGETLTMTASTLTIPSQFLFDDTTGKLYYNCNEFMFDC